jgi:hypothetical protein
METDCEDNLRRFRRSFHVPFGIVNPPRRCQFSSSCMQNSAEEQNAFRRRRDASDARGCEAGQLPGWQSRPVLNHWPQISRHRSPDHDIYVLGQRSDDESFGGRYRPVLWSPRLRAAEHQTDRVVMDVCTVQYSTSTHVCFAVRSCHVASRPLLARKRHCTTPASVGINLLFRPIVRVRV